MAPMPSGRWWLCACLALGACRAEPLFVPSATDGLLAVLALDAEGAVVAVSACYAPCSVEPQRIEVPAATADVLVIRVSQAAIARSTEDFDPARAAEVTLLAESRCEPGRAPDGKSREVLLPAEAAVLVAHVASGERQLSATSAAQFPVIARAVLSVPIKDQRCPLPGSGKLRPFGSRFQGLGSHATIAGVDWVADDMANNYALAHWQHAIAVDTDHLLVHSARAIALIERGVDYEGRVVPSELVPTVVPTGTVSANVRDHVTDLLVERDGAGAARRIYALGGLADGRGFIREVEVVGGHPRFSATATIVPARLITGIIQSDGSLLAVGGRDNGEGMQSVGFAVEQSAQGRRSVDFPGELLTCVAESGIPGRPHLAGTDGGAVYFGDLWHMAARKEVSIINRSDLQGIAMVMGPTEPEIWVTSQRLGFFRRPLSAPEFSRVDFEVPQAFIPCAGTLDRCGRPTELAGRVELFSVASSGPGAGRIFTSLNGCNGALSVRPRDGCLSAISDLDAPFVLTGKTGWRAAAIWAERVFYVGSAGTAGELVLE